MATVIETVNLVMSDIGNNNNKFWFAQLFDNDDVFCKWGRVGDDGQSKPFPAAGKSFIDKKVREKIAKGYRKIDVVASGSTIIKNSSSPAVSEIRDIAKKQIKSNNPIVEKLIERLAKENAHNIFESSGGKITYNDTTGLFSTPLGIIGQETIDKANNVLIEIGDLVANGKYDSELNNLTNDYMMLVPTEIGRTRLDVRDFWRDLSKVQYQKQIVDSLQSSLVSASNTQKTKDTIEDDIPKVFDCQLNLVEDGKIIDTIRNFYNKTRQKIHSSYNLDVKTVYSVEINTVKSAFNKHGTKMSNIMTLFHGTKISNVLSILKAGLVIPPRSSPHVCGRLYGDGLYFSDQSTKSLNYATGGVWDGSGKKNDNCFMFLCTVAMGSMYKPNRNNYQSIVYPIRGYDSTFAEAGSGVMNNEMIVYKVSQCNLVNLIEFSPNGK